MSFVSHQYYFPKSKETTTTTLDGLPVEKITSLVNRAALSNGERQAEAIRLADSNSFWVAHPELLRTSKNIRLINHWLTSKNITNPMFADFEASYTSLKDSPLLEIDKAKLTKQQGGNGPRTFKGTITKRTFDSLDEMILTEREAAMQQVPQQSTEEIALENMPHEQALALLRNGEQTEQRNANLKETRLNADGFLTLHPEIVDTNHNAYLIKMQLRTNGVAEGKESIEDFEVATRQLRASGLLTLNGKEIAKQEAEALQQRVNAAINIPGSVFDKTTLEEMELLPLDEVRRRGNGNYSGVD